MEPLLVGSHFVFQKPTDLFHGEWKQFFPKDHIFLVFCCKSRANSRGFVHDLIAGKTYTIKGQYLIAQKKLPSDSGAG